MFSALRRPSPLFALLITDSAARARKVARSVAFALGRVAAKFGGPSTPLEWYRWALLAVTLVNVVLIGPVLLSEDAVAWPVRVAATGALAALSWWWVHQYHRGTFPLMGTMAEAACLWLVGVAVGDPLAALGLLYPALYYRSMYGSPGRVTFGAVAYLGAHYGAVLIAVEPTIALSLSQVLLQVTGV